jgi:hypothetical protein
MNEFDELEDPNFDFDFILIFLSGFRLDGEKITSSTHELE